MKTLDAVIASSNQPDQKLLSWMLLVQRLCFIITGIIATVILCGWLIPAFGAILPTGWALMKANTALAMLLSTASLALIQQEQSDRRTLISRICAALVVLLAGAALFGHLTGRSVALNTLLAADSSADMPGRMSIQTAAFLMLLGLALAFEGKWQKRHSHVVDLLTIILGVITLVIIAGYCFGAAQLFGQSPSTRTSLQTLVCMATLGFAIVVRRTQAGFFSVFIGMGIGSHIARIALPFALLLPFLVVGSGAYLMLAHTVGTVGHVADELHPRHWHGCGVLPVPPADLVAQPVADCWRNLVAVGLAQSCLQGLFNRGLGEGGLPDAPHQARPGRQQYQQRHYPQS